MIIIIIISSRETSTCGHELGESLSSLFLEKLYMKKNEKPVTAT